MSHVVLNTTVYHMLCEAIMFVYNLILIDYLKKTKQKNERKKKTKNMKFRIHQTPCKIWAI